MPGRSRTLLAVLILFLAILLGSAAVAVYRFDVLSRNAQSAALSGTASPDLGSTDPSEDELSRASLGLPDDDEKPASGNEPSLDSGYRKFNHRPEQDPQTGKIFVVSFRFSFSRLPVRYERRMRLISKYDAQAASPFPGWVIAVRPMKTSVRPEIYWQTPDGTGGWFTFEKFDLLPMKIYQGTLIVKPGEQMSLFMGEVSDLPSGETSTGELSSSDNFMGGYSLRGMGVPATTQPVKFAASLGTVTVSRLVVAQLAEPFKLNRRALARFAQGGTDAVRSRIPNENVVVDYPPDAAEIVLNDGSAE